MEIDKQMVFNNLKSCMIRNDDKYKTFFEENAESINKVVELVCDLSLTSILNFSERDTYVIRKKLGIFDNGIVQTANVIFQSLDNQVSSQRINSILVMFYYKIVYYCNYSYKLQDNMKTDEILNLDIRSLNLSIRSVNALLRHEVRTIKDLVNLKIRGLSGVVSLGEVSKEEVINVVHSMGLLFADEVKEQIENQSDIETNQNGKTR